MLGGSTPIPEVKEAMERAGDSYIPLMELEEKVGSYISDLIGVPAAYVTSGAGSALTLAAAAVMAGDNDDFIQQLPNTSGKQVKSNERKVRFRLWVRALHLQGTSIPIS
mgnify:CR=1 FL=1